MMTDGLISLNAKGRLVMSKIALPVRTHYCFDEILEPKVNLLFLDFLAFNIIYFCFQKESIVLGLSNNKIQQGFDNLLKPEVNNLLSLTSKLNLLSF